MSLRKKTIVVDDEELVIQEMSVAGHMEMGECDTETTVGKWKASLIICKYGVVDWAELSTDEIAVKISPRTIEEVTPQVMELSGMGSDADEAEAEREKTLEVIEKN